MDYCDKQKIIEIFKQYGTGYKNHNDPLFTLCNHLIKPFKRLGVYSQIDDEEENLEKNNCKSELITCNVPGCKVQLKSLAEYEVHYNNAHRLFCCVCKKNFPNAHLLDLHLLENHDSFFSVQAERKPMYSCFLEECNYKSRNASERRDHCISGHNFPHNFRFDKIINSKSHLKMQNNNAMDTATTTTITTMIPSSSSASDEKINNIHLKNFTFGHSKIKTFAMPPSTKSKKNSKQETILNDDDNRMITDLIESLPE